MSWQPKIYGKRVKGEGLNRLRDSSYFTEDTFVNPVHTRLRPNMFKVMKDYWGSNGGKRKPAKAIPVNLLDNGSFGGKPAEDFSMRWLGHASSLIEMSGVRMLTDPVFSYRVSPISFMGPSRLHESPLNADTLPEIDLIIISHNHYDHLDFELIRQIANRRIRYIVPLGVGSYLEHWGIAAEQITELDWHQTFKFKGLSITAAPARHFTGRGIFDRNKSHWASFVIASDQYKVFFCGDSGFFDGFKDIGEQYGPFDITMIGIGAYNKEWHAIHTNPAEAVKAHELLKGKFLLPIHWCTFDLAPHGWDDPIEWAVREAEEAGVELLIPKIGSELFPEKRAIQHWWR